MSDSAMNYSGGFSSFRSSIPVVVAEFIACTLDEWQRKTKSFSTKQINQAGVCL